MPQLTDKSKSTVTLTRNTGSWGFFSPITIYANDDNIGKLNHGETASFDVGEGTYRFRVEMSGGYKSDDLILDMSEGETAHIDISTIRAAQNVMPAAIALIAVNLWGLMSRGVLSSSIRLVICLVCLFVFLSIFSQRKQLFLLY